MRRALTADYGFSRAATIALVWWICGGLAVTLSLLQLPLVTRAFDITDILFRFLGIAVGLLLRSKYIAYARTLSSETLAQTHGRLAITACAATLVYIVYIGLIPFTIDLEKGGPSRALASSDFLPFFAYFATRFDLMMADVMEKFVSYAAFAALLATVWTRARHLEATTRVLVLGVVGMAVATPLEIAQMYIPVRVPSLTDLILAGCGSTVGVLVQERAVMFYRLATLRDDGRPESLEREHTRQDGLAPADALIATLMDPYPEAPEESVPEHTPKSG